MDPLVRRATVVANGFGAWSAGFAAPARALLALLVVVTGPSAAPFAVAQSPPPAVRAGGAEHWREVLPPDGREECEARCRSNEEYEICSAPLCAAGAHPMLAITEVREASRGRLAVSGHFGSRRSDRLLALVELRDSGDPRRGPRLHVRNRLQAVRWTESEILASVHAEVQRDREYGVVVLYNLTEGRAVAPVFQQGSNVVNVHIRRR